MSKTLFGGPLGAALAEEGAEVERIGGSHGSTVSLTDKTFDLTFSPVRIDAPSPPDTHVQAVLRRDLKTGLLRWARPVEERDGRRTYRTAPEAPEEVFLIRALKAHDALSDIEAVLRPYKLWRYTRDSYQRGNGDAVDGGFWQGHDRALGVIHGFLDRVDSAFGSDLRGPLAATTVDTLVQRYGGQVFAFDHPTVTASPEDNATWLLKSLPASPSKVTLDLLCHSRGGLVARMLERETEALGALNIHIGKIIFVGTPNAGTPLTDIGSDEGRLVHVLLDVYTNLFQHFGGEMAKEAIQMMLHLAGSPFEALAKEPGVTAMRPGGDFLRKLNASTFDEQRHFAITSDFDSTDVFLAALRDLVQPIFAEVNDLVVPTDGVMGADRFRIGAENEMPFGENDGVHHLAYFGRAALHDQMLDWLSR